MAEPEPEPQSPSSPRSQLAPVPEHPETTPRRSSAPTSGASRDVAQSRRSRGSSELLRRASTRSGGAHDSAGEQRRASHDLPNDYANLNELAAPLPLWEYEQQQLHRVQSLEDSRGTTEPRPPGPGPGTGTGTGAGSVLHRRASTRSRRHERAAPPGDDLPNDYANLNELSAPSPLLEHDLRPPYRLPSLEDSREVEPGLSGPPEDGTRVMVPGTPGQPLEIDEEAAKRDMKSRFATQLYTHSYLIFFSMLGTWARLGLSELTTFPGAPVTFNIVWSNFGGCIIIGFLAEDQMLFRQGYGPSMDSRDAADAMNANSDDDLDLTSTRTARQKIKKTIPLYIGLATGFCGSFTSFSSFIRDAFLALSNDIASPDIGYPPHRRRGGDSFMAFLAVVITSIAIAFCGLFLGLHLASELERITPTLPYKFTRKVLDRLIVPLGLGSWIVILFLTLFPPHESWRSTPLLDLVFSPLGCLARFYLSILLNGKIASFPLGTFTANVLGTTLLGVFWSLNHAGIVGISGCQVLSSIQDGFCGCLTTVSTWVLELATLRRAHAYIYGSASVLTSLAMLIAIMGGLRWTHGFTMPIC
ncbi:related to chromosome condensation protein (CrcB) [Cephalotrichum gorgonifer]|uniref:Related to chromosome condensation protein (CrcB) n=1 Tax=Cephalotrichum gorgonifer TaxID=2041049 RepID=A0AAE8SVX1_9PEZI|nr:related to chromosome condensation protein (CrcB) [Cephalotrichum gorgonifer]